MRSSAPALAVALAGAAVAALAGVPAPALGAEPEELICDRVLEDFSATEAGSFPQGWRTKYDHTEAEAREKKIYVVEKAEGGQALHATYGTHTITVLRALPAWDLQEYPVLAWRWKAVQLPRGGDESSLSRNDSAASVYLVWDVGGPFRISFVRFAWSSTLPVGRVVTRRFGHDRIVVAESGPAKDGLWREEKVDLLAEARTLLDTKRPASPAALSLTTDADATASSAEAYYADFRLCRRPARDQGEKKAPARPGTDKP